LIVFSPPSFREQSCGNFYTCNESLDLERANSLEELSSFISPSSFIVIDFEDSEIEFSESLIFSSKV
jgi:hypothetical protein